MGGLEAEAQREQQESRDRDDLGREQPPGVRVQLLACRANEQGEAIEQVGGPIGKDRPGQEGNPMFPAEDHGGHVGAEAGDPVGEPIAEEEERGQPGKPSRRQLPGIGVEEPCGQATEYQFVRYALACPWL